MSTQKQLNKQQKRRALHNRNRMVSRGSKLRISVFRSLKHIYAQIIDDAANTTVVSYSSKAITKPTGDKKAIAKQVGLELGKRAMEKSVGEVFFDRGSFAYHGRIASLAEGLRESGLKF